MWNPFKPKRKSNKQIVQELRWWYEHELGLIEEMKTLRVGIATYEEMKARSIAIASGELKRSPDSPRVWFTSVESFAKVLSRSNQALLRMIKDK